MCVETPSVRAKGAWSAVESKAMEGSARSVETTGAEATAYLTAGAETTSVLYAEVTTGAAAK